MFKMFSLLAIFSVSCRLLRRLSIVAIALSLSSTVHAGWEVQWIDSFEGYGVDWSNWTAQTKANYNNEVQCYTADDYSSERNFEVSNGTLKIIARKKDNNCSTLGGQQKYWTSGRINSKDKQEFLYGRIEARIRFHNLEAGTWPAFWMLENRIAEQPIKGDNDTVNWPLPGAGEIDVWEWFSNQPGSYITNFYNAANCGGEFRYRYPNGATDVQQWHKYAIEWTADNIDFYVNETLVISRDVRNCAQYKEPMFVLLNLAMGGNLGGFIDPALEQATLEIDYIAHCIASDSSTASYCDESAPIAGEQSPITTPVINIEMTQAGRLINEVQPLSGEVQVSASFEFEGEYSDYVVEWDVSELPDPIIVDLPHPEESIQQVTFDPSSMLDGDYSIGVTMTHLANDTVSQTQPISLFVRSVSEPQNPNSGGGSGGWILLASLLVLALVRRSNFTHFLFSGPKAVKP